MICVSGQSKCRPVKAAGAESCGQRRNQKSHAAEAKSTFWSEHVQDTSGPKHFLYLRYRKIARRCGEKHIWKWKCTKHVSSEALFVLAISKNCTPLWREAHFEVKMFKARQFRSTFWSSDVEKLHAAVARSQNVKKLTVLEHFLKFRCQRISHLASSSVNQSVN